MLYDAKDLGIEKQLHLLGYRTDVAELYAMADIFVFPSLREGLSVSLMEAMSSGLPCVVSKIRGNVDLIQAEKGGFLCSPASAWEFAEAISKLSDDRKLRYKMGK